MLICSVLLVGIIKIHSYRNQRSSENLDAWLGEYEYVEFIPDEFEDWTRFIWIYDIYIYKDDEEYFADVNVDGRMTLTRIKATVKGDKDSIDLVFAEYMPDNIYEFYNIDDILLSFSLKNDNLITTWQKMEQNIPKNSEEGVYFTKIYILDALTTQSRQ